MNTAKLFWFLTQGDMATFTYTSYTPTWTGFSADPTGVDFQYAIVGKLIHIVGFAGDGTSNATTLTFTLPAGINARTGAVQSSPAQVKNAGAFNSSPGLITTRSGSNVVDAYTSYSGQAWTNTGAKTIRINAVFIID